jgi:hypothetical protein
MISQSRALASSELVASEERQVPGTPQLAEGLTDHRLHEQWRAENGWQGLDDAEIGRRITAQLRQEENAKGAPRGVVRSPLR